MDPQTLDQNAERLLQHQFAFIRITLLPSRRPWALIPTQAKAQERRAEGATGGKPLHRAVFSLFSRRNEMKLYVSSGLWLTQKKS
ncbi:MAG TPA: hypothetical protein DCZ04_04670 [Syntrophorhabdus aromaticivorans]|nr:hypothetical protein [Syntrophorhabdus aromaticivorans]